MWNVSQVTSMSGSKSTRIFENDFYELSTPFCLILTLTLTLTFTLTLALILLTRPEHARVIQGGSLGGVGLVE